MGPKITIGKLVSWGGEGNCGLWEGQGWCLNKGQLGWLGKVVRHQGAKLLGQVWHGGSRLLLPICCLPALVLTLQTGSDGIVHGPADQSHEEPQQDQEDPVFTNPGHQELMAAYGTDCEQGREEWAG